MPTKEDGFFTVVEDKMWKIRDIYSQLDALDIVLICRIQRFGICTMSNQTLGKLFRVSPKTIQTHINKLSEIGIIQKRRKLIYDTVVGREMRIDEDKINVLIEMCVDEPETEDEWR